MDIFSWHKTLNKKKIILVCGILVFFIVICIFSFDTDKEDTALKQNNTQITPSTNTVFFDLNKTISIELPKIYNLTQYTPKENYLIELRSEENLNIFLSYKENLPGKDFKDVVSADKLAFTEAFEKTSNLSEIKEITVNGYSAFTYSFHYLDETLHEAFYIQIVWILVDNNYYIFDIEFPLDALNNYTNVINDALHLFKKI